jgi:hypothetical protein
MMKRIFILFLLSAGIIAGIWSLIRLDRPSDVIVAQEVESIREVPLPEQLAEEEEDEEPLTAEREVSPSSRNETAEQTLQQPRKAPLLDFDEANLPPHFDPEKIKKILDTAKEIRKRRSSLTETAPYADAPTSQERSGQKLASYYDRWRAEKENPDTSEQGREWLLERFNEHQVLTDDLEVSCRETLCRIRITLPEGETLDALGRYPTQKRHIIRGNPELINNQFVLAVYHPIEDGRLDLEDE